MKKTTLTKKLLKFILPLLVIPISLLSIFYYQYLTHLLTDDMIELSKSTINNSDEYLQKIAIVDQTFIYILFIIIFIVFISIVLTIIFSFNITNPIKSLIEESRRVISGDLSNKIEVSSNDEVGELVQSFNIMIEKRRAVESNLEKQNEMLNKSQHTARLGSWKWDMISNEVTWTDEVFRIFEEEVGSFIPTYERLLSYLDDKDKVNLERAIASAIKNNEPYSIEYKIRYRDGSICYLQGSGKTYYSDTGDAISMIGTILDITIMSPEKQPT